MTAARPAGAAGTPVASPCVDVCRMDADSGLCVGCLRTLDEIAGWSRMDDVAKREVWARLPAREQAAQEQQWQQGQGPAPGRTAAGGAQ